MIEESDAKIGKEYPLAIYDEEKVKVEGEDENEERNTGDLCMLDIIENLTNDKHKIIRKNLKEARDGKPNTQSTDDWEDEGGDVRISKQIDKKGDEEYFKSCKVI